MAGPYNFHQVLVSDIGPGGSVRTLRNGKVTVRSATGIAPSDAGTGAVIYNLTSDSKGTVTFTTGSTPVVDLVAPSGFVKRVVSPDSYTEAASAAASAASAASSAAASATSASNAAGLVGAPAGAAVDARNSSGLGFVAAATASLTDVQAALDDAATNGKRALAYGTITTSSTIVIKSDADLTQLTINYTGTGVAVQIGNGVSGNPGILFRKDIKLPTIVNTGKTGTGWAAGTVGVKAINTYGCTIRTSRISGFETGYYAYGLGTGNVYNDVFLSHLDNNKRNLVLGAGSGGWSNSNTYRLGLLTHNTSEGSNVAGARQILIETATNIVNGNLFLGGSVEGNVAEYHLDCDGLYNRFLELRWENAGGCRVIWRANAARNVIDYGYNAQAIIETAVTGSTLNRLYSTSMSRIMGSTSKAINVYENTSGSGAGVDAIMDPGAYATGADPATAYRVFRSADATKMKRATDAGDRLILDHVNARVYMGSGAAAPTMYLAPVGTSGMGLTGGNLYFGADNTQDVGLAGSLRPRYVRIGTAVQTGAFATGSRPSASTAGAGAMVFDTTLNKPIWSTGSAWVDATGTTV